MQKETLLFCASEVYPFAKTGGLADVAHALPRALQKEYTLQVVMPLYSCIDTQKFDITPLDKEFYVLMNEIAYDVTLYGCRYEDVEYIFIYSPLLSDREFLYGTPTHGYQDNPVRFAIFNHAIIHLLKEGDYSLAHLNDWQSALVPLLIHQDPLLNTKTLLTIHNLAYQGVFEYEALHSIGVDEKYFTLDALEFYAKINFLKAGIAFADAITTVSPSYAKEILTPEFGCGLEGFLQHHQKKITGILNGIDTQHFSPQSDTLIEYPYTTLTQKAQNKKSFLKEVGLRGIKKPFFIFIGRFTAQKGVELIIDTLEKIASLECNVVILGDGEVHYQNKVQEIALRYKNIHFEFTYNEKLSHRLYASADFLLMPSLFEPCGLNQMISMRYGSLPIVHSVGGLKDSVQNYKRFHQKSKKGYGIVFKKAQANAFLGTLQQALLLFENKKEYNRVIKHNMLCDFSWKKSAKLYSKIYKQL